MNTSETSSLNESDIILRAQKGEKNSLRALYERFHLGIFRYLYYQVGDTQLAEDLAGDVFLRMLQAFPSFQPQKGSFRAWLYQIAHNLAVDHHRKAAVRLMVPLHEDLMIEENDPAETSEMRLTSATLKNALLVLNHAQREVIVLRFIAGLPIEQVAQTVGKSPDAIKGLQRRGLAELRQILADAEVSYV